MANKIEKRRSRDRNKCWRIPMKYLSAFVLLTALAAPVAAQNQRTFYNEKGQTTGTATTSGNTTTFRNERGQTTGTATTDSGGTTTFRNSLGQTTGRATGRRN
jgi:hypothetical protein